MHANTEYIEVAYAASNRCVCQTCQQAIPKNQIKIGYVHVKRIPGTNYGGKMEKKIWYHMKCLNQMPKGYRNIELDIVNLHTLKPEDQETVKAKMTQLKSNGYQKKDAKELKFLTKQEHFNIHVKEPKKVQDKITKSMYF